MIGVSSGGYLAALSPSEPCLIERRIIKPGISSELHR
jgi:hypothetical protein